MPRTRARRPRTDAGASALTTSAPSRPPPEASTTEASTTEASTTEATTTEASTTEASTTEASTTLEVRGALPALDRGPVASPATLYAGEPAARNDEADDARGEDVVAALTDALDGPDLATTRARDGHRVPWRPEWPRYSFDEAVLTVGLGVLLLAAELLPNASFTPNWRGGVLFDEGIRSGLRLDTFPERESARIAADALMWVDMAFPVVLDALLVVGLGDWNWDAAFQMGLISVEAYVISLVVWRVTALLARRQRPLDTACELGDTSPHCDSRLATQSFFSNHTTNAFTGAALTCLHHSSMPIFGDVGWDGTACVSATLLATTVGLLRVMSDHEYLTDVLTGAAVGWLSGFVLPWLLHYQGGARPELRAPLAVIPAPMLGHETYGLQAAGWF
jgi:membrane-associated phospholipid phosphatase